MLNFLKNPYKKKTKKKIIKNKQFETFKLFFPLFPIIEELHHLHKAMGKGSTSLWHMQHN